MMGRGWWCIAGDEIQLGACVEDSGTDGGIHMMLDEAGHSGVNSGLDNWSEVGHFSAA
jgi:hypothetical protein